VPPYAVEPGTRLVDRYRLEEPLGEAGGTTYWRAHDELLDRPVGICLLPEDADGARDILSAARRAAAVTDPRFLRVLDASETDDVVYVVTEWVKASSLADLLADGPLSPDEARAMTMEITDALAAAHRQGLAHLCLRPEHVLRTAHGQVKVAGLAVDAAVRGLRADSPDDAARRDTRGCAAVLYAALTARWPGVESTGLAQAPRDAGELCSPRQVRAGIPDDLDDVTARALGEPVRHGAEPLRTPEEFGAQLAAAHVTARIAPTAEPPPSDGRGDTPYPPSYLAAYDEDSRRGRGLATRAAWVLAGLVLVVGLGLAGWQLVMAAMDGSGGSKTSQPSASGAPRTTTGRPLKVVGAEGFDPQGDGEENSDRAGRVLDGDPSTVWTTKTYFDPFGPGGLKEGVGLLLDLGGTKTVSEVAVSLQGSGTDVQVRVADSRGAQASDYRTVAQASNKTGLARLRPDQPVSARYVLIWLTSLPPVDGSNYRGGVSEVEVRG
jgi:protein kinase-like protein